MTTEVVRVPERVKEEVQVAARVTGRNPAELYEEAWRLFKASPQFEVELRTAQKALASGDIETVTNLILEQAAGSAALAIAESRQDNT